MTGRVGLAMTQRKGRQDVLAALSGMGRTVAAHKGRLVTASLVVYIGAYLVFGLAGVNLSFQPVTGYVPSSQNTVCPQGSLWVEGNDLHWCDGSWEYRVTDDASDAVTQVGSVGGDPGSLWVEGGALHWIDSGGVEYYYTGGDTGDNPGVSAGSVWVEDGRMHYIDASGNERIFRSLIDEGFESYSDGTTPSGMPGWSAGADCGTCEVDSTRAEDGSLSFYANVGSTDDWQDVLIRDISATPIKHQATVSFEYWESSSNHDGNIWVRACDGTNLAGIGTENPQFEAVTGTSGEVINVQPSGSDGTGPDYQDWTYAEMIIDLDAATVDFRWVQDGDEQYDSDGYSIASGKDICTIGVGPDDVWSVDDIRIEGY